MKTRSKFNKKIIAPLKKYHLTFKLLQNQYIEVGNEEAEAEKLVEDEISPGQEKEQN